MSVLAKIAIGVGIVVFSVSVLGLIGGSIDRAAQKERAQITAIADAKAKACELADDRYRAVELCIATKGMCFYSPSDLYDARQANKFIAASCK